MSVVRATNCPVPSAHSAKTHALRPKLTTLLALLAAFGAVAAAPAVANATYVHWNKSVRVEPLRDGGVVGVSCPWTSLCVAVDQSGNVVATTSPARGKWTAPFKVESASDGGLTAISCPTTKLCVAVDQSGDVLTSSNPAGGARYWTRPARIDSTTTAGGDDAGLSAVSCASVRLCVAVDQAGNVYTSTNPSGGASTWSSRNLGAQLNAVSCSYDTSFCVVGGSQLYWSTSPSGSAAAWHAGPAPQGGASIDSLACEGTIACVGVGFANQASGFALASSDPKAASSWTTGTIIGFPPLSGEGVIDGIGCPSHRFCIAVDGNDNAYWSTSPTTGTWGAPAPIRKGSVSFTSAISCNPKQCVVVDSAGVATTGIVR